MLTVVDEFALALRRLDPLRAQYLENLVRDAIRLAEAAPPPTGWPDDYFEQTAGAFANEPLERAPQGELPQRDSW